MNKKLSTLLTTCLLFSLVVKAQLNNTYGSYRAGNELIFASLDITTGTFTDIDTLAGIDSYSSGESTFDTDNGYHITSSNLGITVVDIQTGSLVNTFPNTKEVNGLEYDHISSKIYGSYWTGNEEIFTSMDMTTGTFTDIDTLTGVDSNHSGESSFDADNGYYIRSTNLGITVVDIQTGSLVNTFPNTKEVNGLEYDHISSKVFGSYWTGNEEIFTSMDMTTGAFTDIDTLTGVNALYNGESTFDTNNGYYIRSTNLGIIIVDTQTGSIVNTFPNTNGLNGIEFHNSILTLGAAESSLKNQFDIYPNPTQDIINIISENDAKIEITVLDYLGELIYAKTMNSGRAVINFDTYSSGVYFVKLSNSKETITQKIVKK